MGRDTGIYIFIGRKCTEQETKKIKEYANKIEDYYDIAYIGELNEDKPFMKIENYPVVLIVTRDGNEIWYICEKLVGYFDIEYQKEPVDLDIPVISNENHKLLLVSEISF